MYEVKRYTHMADCPSPRWEYQASVNSTQSATNAAMSSAQSACGSCLTQYQISANLAFVQGIVPCYQIHNASTTPWTRGCVVRGLRSPHQLQASHHPCSGRWQAGGEEQVLRASPGAMEG